MIQSDKITAAASSSSIDDDNNNDSSGNNSSNNRIIIQYALIDISGTICQSDSFAIDGAVDAITKLQTVLGPQNVLFLTNTTTVSRTTLYEQLVALGFTIPSIDSIMTSASAVCQYVQHHKLHPYCLVEPDLLSDLQFTNTTTTQSSATSTRTTDEVISLSSSVFLSKDDELYDSVLVGLSPSNFQYDILNRAYRILRNHYRKQQQQQSLVVDASNNNTSGNNPLSPSPPHRLLCFHRSLYYKDPVDGELSLGPGSFIACLEESIKASFPVAAESISAYVVGKPSYGFYQAAIRQFQKNTTTTTTTENSNRGSIQPQSIVMIGDDYRNDIIGASKAHIGNQILVQTGKYQNGDETNCTSLQNFITVPSIVEAIEYIISTCITKEQR